jgi:cystathionine beta-lyase family protein involved in aluminum resistance
MGCRDLSPEIQRLADKALEDIAPVFRALEETALLNTKKVLSVFQKHRVSDACLTGTTGYGYNDKGRDTLDRVFAAVFGAESALVRIGFVGGTHAITAALFGVLKTGDVLLSATGTPYDTLRGAIGIEGNYRGSLKDYGVAYVQTDLNSDGTPDYRAIARKASTRGWGLYSSSVSAAIRQGPRCRSGRLGQSAIRSTQQTAAPWSWWTTATANLPP